MKKLPFLLIVILFIPLTVIPQPCLPNGITFSTQSQIDSFQINYPNCNEIQGDVVIEEAIVDSINNLNGLNVLVRIWGDLRIKGNAALTGLSGLDNLIAIDSSLKIYFNDALISLTGLNNLITVGKRLQVSSNNNLTSLNGLENVYSIGGNLNIVGNASLTSLTGLDNLSLIGESLLISSNDNLVNLSGLENVISIGGDLSVWNNDLLENLLGLDTVTNIGGWLDIWGNNSLKSLTGLENIISIGGSIWIESNDSLSSLFGIENINPASIDSILITANHSLSFCEVKSICDYLINPDGIIYISDNATGCSSRQEVEDACGNISVDDIDFKNEVNIYPNPAERTFYITMEKGAVIIEVNIYTQHGQMVLNEKRRTEVIDVSMLKKGMYVVEVVSEDWTHREKLIISY